MTDTSSAWRLSLPAGGKRANKFHYLDDHHGASHRGYLPWCCPSSPPSTTMTAGRDRRLEPLLSLRSTAGLGWGSTDKTEVVPGCLMRPGPSRAPEWRQHSLSSPKDGQWHVGYDKTPSADGSPPGPWRAVAVAAVADNTKAAGVDASTMTKGMSLQTGQVKPSDGTSEAVRYMLAIVFSVLFMMSASIAA